MADETMFARLRATLQDQLFEQCRYAAVESCAPADGGRYRIEGDVTLDLPAIVRALLAELRAHGMSDDVMAKLADAGVDVGDAKTIWAEAIDAILAEAGK